MKNLSVNLFALSVTFSALTSPLSFALVVSASFNLLQRDKTSSFKDILSSSKLQTYLSPKRKNNPWLSSDAVSVGVAVGVRNLVDEEPLDFLLGPSEPIFIFFVADLLWVLGVCNTTVPTSVCNWLMSDVFFCATAQCKLIKMHVQ